MGRLEESLRIADELLADIELKRLKTSEIVLKASRLARLVGHEDLMEFLELERNGYGNHPKNASLKRWVKLSGRTTPEDEKMFNPNAISKIEAFMEATRESIEALRGGGNYSGDYIVAASREHDSRISYRTKELARYSGIAGQVKSTVYDFVTEIYYELLFSELQASLFADTQDKVDGLLSESSGSALSKIEIISERLRDGDPESVSQALTTCRRLIDSCADSVFPSRSDSFLIGEQPLKVGPQNVLNRLQAYVYGHEDSENRRTRLRRTLSDLYNCCSAGTHAEVTVEEARFIFLQTYVALGEILTLPSSTSGDSANQQSKQTVEN